jgi:hypothetical protein
VADAGALHLDEDFVVAGLLYFDVIADLEDAVGAWVVDPADGLGGRDGHGEQMMERLFSTCNEG